MGEAELRQERSIVSAQAAARYGARDVPTDWYVDPADPGAAARFREDNARALEDAATAFLAAHEVLDNAAPDADADGGDAPDSGQQGRASLNLVGGTAGPSVGTAPGAPVWIGLPGFGSDFADEDEYGWQTDALCAQTDPEAFFPEKGGSTRDAKKVCGACTVRADCLEYALANDERFGIWGGLSERERRRLRKRAI